MPSSKQKWSWAVDALLFAGFLVAMWLDLTGLAMHQWWGIAVAALAVYHLVAHRHWVSAVTGRLARGRASANALQKWSVDAGVAIGFVAITITGVAMSTWLGLDLAAYEAWRTVHVVVSVATLALIMAKIALHWRWIVSTAHKIFGRAQQPARRPEAAGGLAVPQPVPAAVTRVLGRREFVGLMVSVGAVSLWTGAKALAPEHNTAESATDIIALDGASIASTSTSRATSSTCSVACGRRCSYPGHCRRYADSNNNGRCDLGECTSGTETENSAAGGEAPGGQPFGSEATGVRPARGRRG